MMRNIDVKLPNLFMKAASAGRCLSSNMAGKHHVPPFTLLTWINLNPNMDK